MALEINEAQIATLYKVMGVEAPELGSLCPIRMAGVMAGEGGAKHIVKLIEVSGREAKDDAIYKAVQVICALLNIIEGDV